VLFGLRARRLCAVLLALWSAVFAFAFVMMLSRFAGRLHAGPVTENSPKHVSGAWTMMLETAQQSSLIGGNNSLAIDHEQISASKQSGPRY
jgi:hypothetical protein